MRRLNLAPGFSLARLPLATVAHAAVVMISGVASPLSRRAALVAKFRE